MSGQNEVTLFLQHASNSTRDSPLGFSKRVNIQLVTDLVRQDHGIDLGDGPQGSVVSMLKQAVQHIQETLDAMPADDSQQQERRDQLEESMRGYKQTLDTTPETVIDLAEHMVSYSTGFILLFGQTGDRAYLDPALDIYELVIDATPEDHPERLYRLDQGIQVLQLVLDQVTDYPHRGSLFEALGNRFRDRYRKTNQVADLDKATSHYLQALDATPPSHQEHLATLDQVISFSEKVLKDAPGDHQCRRQRLINLGKMYRDRFRRTDSLVDSDRAIQLLREALDTTLEDQPSRSQLQELLGGVFSDRVRRTGKLSDSHEAIQLLQQAYDASLEGCPNQSWQLWSLGIAFSDRFNITRELADLDQSIELLKRSLDITAPDHPDRRELLGCLGNTFGERFKTTEDLVDSDQSIHFLQLALESVQDAPLQRSQWLENLGVALSHRFQRTSQVSYLDRAIQYLEEAVLLHEQRRPVYFYSLDHARQSELLGSLLCQRFERKGQKSDLHDAIRRLQHALSSTPANHPDAPQRYESLAKCFINSFQVTGQLFDLQQSLELVQEALRATPNDHPQRSRRLNLLGLAFITKFGRTNNKADIDQAIQLLEQSIVGMLGKSPERLWNVHALGNAFGARFRKTRETADLTKAIEFLQEAFAATPDDHAERPLRMEHLGVAFHDYFRQTQETIYLDKAILYLQQVTDATPDDHSIKARRLHYLGLAFHDRFLSTAHMSDYESCRVMLQHALECPSYPLDRIGAGRTLLSVFMKTERWIDCAAVIQKVLQILPTAIPRSSSREDMQHTLQQFSGLSSISTSIYIKTGSPPLEALRVLEQTRAIITGLMMDARFDVSALKDDHYAIWRSYSDMQGYIADKHQEYVSILSGSTLRQSHTTMLQKNDGLESLYEDLENRKIHIRENAGFESFLASATEDNEIRELAHNGPIVCFNISDISSEAFLVTKTAIEILPLPNLKQSDIHKQIRVFAERGNPARRDATLIHDEESEPSDDVSTATALLSLWDNAVKPVLQKLNLIRPKGSTTKLPRIWWVGGIMSLLPLHAAGDHTLGSINNALSHVVSSYSTSFKALQLTKRKPRLSIDRTSHQIMMVTMPQTPGHKDLQVQAEAEAIKRLAEPLAEINILQQPDKASVLAALKSCTIAHFACHGTSDSIEPDRSALIIGKEKEERVTIRDIDTIIHKDAYIAYLSACSTAELKVHALIDEGVHLASSFQLAGFQHVVGTLWGADDAAAVEVASKFYEGLLDRHVDDTEGLVAYSLHNAIKSYRDKPGNSKEFLKWAPFIHVGP